MSAAQLIGKLGAVGIKLWLDEEAQLRFKAPKGALNAELKAELIAHKQEVIRFLGESKNKKLSDTIPRLSRNPEQEYHLSFAQQRFWFLDRLEPGNPSLHIPAAIRIKGPLNIAYMRKAFNALAQRHESLRSYFVIDEHQQVQQKIEDSITWQLEENYDLSHLNPHEREQRVFEIIQEEALRPFNLNKPCNGKSRFLRTRIIRLSATSKQYNAEAEHILLINMHHIIADGWSINLLIGELSANYQALIQKKSLSLMPLDIQYIDFAQWQRKWMQSELMQSQLNYWKQTLDGIPVLELPTDFPRPKQSSHHGRNIHFTINQKKSDALKSLAQQQKSSVFNCLLAAFNLLLFRHTGQKDFAVGTPVAGRNRQDIEQIIGCFINLLALRTHIDPELSFNDYLAQVQQSLLTAFEHQDLPFERIAEEFSDNRSLAHTPIFQTLFTLQNNDDLSLNIEGLQLSFIQQQSQTAKYDLQLHVDDTAQGFNCTIEYNCDLFSAEHIEDLARHFTNLLNSILDDPLQRISILNIFDDSDEHVFSLKPEDSATHSETNLLDQLNQQAKKSPNAIAISCDQESLSYAQLHQKANHLANILHRDGVGIHDRVGLCLPSGIDAIISILACIKCGAAYVPMDENHPDERLQHMATNAELKTLITHKKLASIFIDITELVLIDDVNLCVEKEPPAITINHQAPVYLIFTSGSTGKPKAAAVSYANESNLLAWYPQQYGFSREDKIIIISSLGFDLTQKNIFAALISGAEIVFSPAKNYDPQIISKTIYEKNVSIINCAPSAFYPLLENCQRIDRLKYLRSLRHVLFGGESIAMDKLKPWIENTHFNASITNMYGPTECADIACAYTIEHPKDFLNAHQPIPMGSAIPGVTIRVLDEQQQPVPLGTTGELYISGASIGLGYFQQEALNNKSFIDNPFSHNPHEKMYRSHDLVRQYKTEQGLQLEFVSRIDDQIKIRGFRVELGEISSQLNQHPQIQESLLIAHKDTLGNQRLLAYYIATDQSNTINLIELRKHLKSKLPDYMIPAAFICIAAWPLSANGKINKKALPEPQQQHSVKAEFVAAHTATQLELTEIWQQLLNLETLGINDDFFELGGHSLTATQMIGQISKVFGIDIALKDFFEQASIAELADIIEQGGHLSHINTLPALSHCDRSQAIPLSLAQERLWIIEQLNPGNPAYNIPAALLFTGQLNIPALEKSIHTLVHRHETLRTRINVNTQGIAEQKIIDATAFSLVKKQMNNDSHLAQSLFDKEANTPFNCNDDVLFRAQLISFNDERYLLMMTMHHLISDGWSINLLQKELSALYHAFAKDQDSPLSNLDFQYADVAVWQRKNSQGEQLQLHLDYWLEHLHDAPTVIQLPMDRARPEQQTFNGAMLSQDLNIELSHKLKIFCAENNTTAFNTLISVFSLLLSKYSQQQDICIGTPVSGREHIELQNLIGYFVNAVVIRQKMTGNPNFIHLLQRTQDTCLGAFAHQNVAIEAILEKLPLERNLSYSPIAQTGFSYISDDFTQPLILEGVEAQALDFEHIVAKYELSCIVIDKGDQFNINFEYNTDLFNADTMQTMQQHFIQLIDHCISHPETHINALDLLNQHELVDALNLQEQSIDAIYPLTAMQYDMVLAQQMQPESLANTLGYHVDIDYAVDINLWKKSLQLVCNAQAITRTQFHNNHFKYGEFAYQVVLNKLDIELDIFDYTQESLTQKDIEQRVNAFIYQPQQYAKNKFIRYGLMQLKDNKTVLVLSAHHALLDGISIVWIAQKTAAVYEALYHQKDPTAACLSTYDFSHYIDENRQLMDSRKVRQYWKKTFSNCEAPDFNLPHSVSPSEHIIKQHSISKSTWEGLGKYCRKNRTTAPQLLKIIYGLLIHHYCRTEEDFYFTDFHAGRNKDNAFALGCFYQQSPFIIKSDCLTSTSTITDLLQYGREFRKESKHLNSISAGLNHELAPTGRLQFMYNYYHFFPQNQKMLGHDVLCTEKPPFVEGAVQLVLKEQEDHMRLDLYYQNHLFDDVNFLERIESLCKQIIKGTELISELIFVTKAEKIQQLYEYNHIDDNEPDHISILQRFEEQVKNSANSIAIKDDSGEITYQELNQRSNKLARYLHDQGVGTDVRVGLCLPHSIDVMVAIIAIIKAGGCYVPIDSSYPEARIQSMLQEGHIHILISLKSLAHLYQSFEGVVIALDANDDDTHLKSIALESESNLSLSNDLDDLFYVIFTSGSTGQPKGTTVTHKGVSNLQNWYLQEFNFDTESRTLVLSALGFDLTQKNLFAPLLSGGQLIFTAMKNYDSGHIHKKIQEHGITLINCAPSAFYPLIEDHNEYEGLYSLKHLILGGESIKLERMRAWIESRSFNAKITNNYGPTECTDIASFYTLDRPNLFFNKNIPIGKPNPHVQVYILNKNQQLLANGLVGEICIGGQGVGRGYLNNDELNHEKFIANPFGQGQLYCTGDLARYGDDGNIYFVHRQDYQIKLNGLRIELGEIEQSLQNQEGIIDSLVLVKDDVLTAYIRTQNSDVNLQDIQQSLSKKLPVYMHPKAFVIMDKWPLTANGKIDRKALPDAVALNPRPEYVAPRDETEQAICDIVAGVLQLEKVGILDNFFELGGHSLAASRAIVQIREHFSIDIPLNILFDMTSVEKLAAYIKASEWAAQSSQQNDEEEGSRDTGFI